MNSVRLAELLGRLSLAFDIANEAPFGKAVRSVVLAVELGRLAGATNEELGDTFWVSLLGYLGCTGFARDDGGETGSESRPTGTPSSIIDLDRTRDTSMQLAKIAGAGPRILSALAELGEPWDGRGGPGHAGKALALPGRLQPIGHLAEITHQRRGREAAVDLLRRRAGGQFDPCLAQIFIHSQEQLFEAIEDPQIFDRFLGLEPKPVSLADEKRIDDIARALALFVDLQCPIFQGHSIGVAELAERAAGQLGFDAEDTQTLRWAALLHDIGRLSVPNSIWTRPGKLDWSERERVRLHAYYSERVLAPIDALGPIAEIVGGGHERLDGSGYPWSRAGRSLPPATRVLAVADAAFAMGEDRPHRPALDQASIASELLSEVDAGRLDGTTVDAVLACLGVEARSAPRASRGLSDREIDVCRFLARGKMNKEIAELLGISSRTVQKHVAHIFDKLGVHSRSGAVIWILEHNLVQ